MLTLVLMLMARSWLATRSAHDVFGGSGVICETSNPFGEAGLGHELLRLRDVRRRGRPLDRARPLLRDPVPLDRREPAQLGVVDRLTVDRQADRLADPDVVERTVRAVQAHLEPVRRRRAGRSAAASGPCGPRPSRSPGIMYITSISPVWSIARRVAASGTPFAMTRLDARHLPPVLRERLELHLAAGLLPHEAERPGPDRGRLEAVLADLLVVRLRHDPAGPAGRAAVDRQEVDERLLEEELDRPVVRAARSVRASPSGRRRWRRDTARR